MHEEGLQRVQMQVEALPKRPSNDVSEKIRLYRVFHFQLLEDTKRKLIEVPQVQRLQASVRSLVTCCGDWLAFA